MHNLSLLEKIQWILQRTLTRLVGLICESRWRWVKNPLIKAMIYIYGIELKDCTRTRIEDYKSVNDFFTRSLRKETRPLPQDKEKYILSPVDGCISQIGLIEGETLLQAKGKTYTLYDLLVGDQDLIRLFQHGSFGTFYLSFRDYHRVHMPVTGKVVHTTYVPGFLFSVGTRNTQNVAQLFTRNERMLTLFNSAIGPMMIIQIGSCLVGHMGTSWEAKDTAPRRHKKVSRVFYSDQSYELAQAEEIGYFKLGSTVIILFAPPRIQWDISLYFGKALRYGEIIGKNAP